MTAAAHTAVEWGSMTMELRQAEALLTEADEAALIQMFDAGCSMEEMQARFQRTNGAIVRRLERLGRLRPGETIK